MSTQLHITSIRVEKSANGWSVVTQENGEERLRQEFAAESEAESCAEGQRILVGNFMTHMPPTPV